ncbi:MAG: hypothetical protein HXY42_02620 [Chloroflexi bacterium]|nr:hypothetical protein [Chloroflexota bacterium]
MKKVLLTILAVIVIVGALAGVGFAGYRIGYVQGAAANGNAPFFARPDRMNPNMPGFRRDFGMWRQPYHAPMMGGGGFGFSFFTPFRFLWNIAVLALIIWFVYWLFTQSGWRITRQTNSESPAAKTDL